MEALSLKSYSMIYDGTFLDQAVVTSIIKTSQPNEFAFNSSKGLITMTIVYNYQVIVNSKNLYFEQKQINDSLEFEEGIIYACMANNPSLYKVNRNLPVHEFTIVHTNAYKLPYTQICKVPLKQDKFPYVFLSDGKKIYLFHTLLNKELVLYSVASNDSSLKFEAYVNE